MENDTLQDDITQDIPIDSPIELTPDEAAASLSFATNLSENMMMQQPIENNTEIEGENEPKKPRRSKYDDIIEDKDDDELIKELITLLSEELKQND